MRRKKSKLRLFFISSFIILILLLLGFIYITFYLSYTSHSDKLKVVTIPKNLNLREISHVLYENDIIRNENLFILATMILNLENKLYPGTYTFKNNLNNYDVLKIISSGEETSIIKVTIREGLTIKQIASLLKNKYNMDSSKFVNLATDEKYIKNTLKLNVNNLEGYLFPNTYIFYEKPDEDDLIRLMVSELKKIFTDSLVEVIHSKKLNIHKVLTMASIVEGEAKIDDERSIIAGVYYNRLKKGMLLEADPTVQYSISDGPRRLFYKDYKTISPYNTYLHPGLPPGPVNNPGKKSIMAAINPSKHSFLYFIADGTGKHIFSNSYQQHIFVKRKIRRNNK